jgi:hypothetical protein
MIKISNFPHGSRVTNNGAMRMALTVQRFQVAMDIE